MKTMSCPICKRPCHGDAYAPFCSKRCADVDLQHWFSGAYAVPVVEAEDAGELEEGQAGRPQTYPL